jgi:prefoldin alpha subunit
MSDAQQAAVEMQTVQRRLQQLDRHLAQLEAAMQEMHAAISTLDGLGDAAEQPTLIPIGAGVRMYANVDATSKIMLDLGNGYSAEFTAEDALEKLRDRLRNTEAAFRATSDDADKFAERMQELQMQNNLPAPDSV